MRRTSRSVVFHLLVAIGAAVLLALVVLSPLVLTSRAADAPKIPLIQRPEPPAVTTPTLKASIAPSEESTPTSVLDLLLFEAGLSPGSPVFSSADMPAGTFSMDWGDLDRDGDLDLALGSTQGTIVYQNTNGQLVKLWENSRYTLGVRWADMDPDSNLELIAVGGSSNGTPQGTSLDYIYTSPEVSQSDCLLNSSFYWAAYYNNPSLSGEPVLARCDSTVDYNWGSGSPDPGVVNSNNFSARWTRSVYISNPVSYTFSVETDDGARVWVDGVPVIDVWYPQPPTIHSSSPIPLSVGWHAIKMEYYEQGGGAVARLWWNPLTADPPVDLRQLLRVAPGDYDNDGQTDVVVSTNALNPPTCPVLMYYPQKCVSNQATASLASADFDNDGDLDLALARHQSKEIRVVINDGDLSDSNPTVLVDSSLAHMPYDLAWGDYDRDGYLDLAAAFPLEQEVRIYHNDAGASFSSTTSIPTSSFLTPLAVDWADFDSDGRLELVVADLPPKVYDYDGSSFTEIAQLSGVTGRIQETRGIDLDNDADLDLALVNQYAPSQVFETTASPLSLGMTQVHTDTFQSVAWGDADGDGFLDLLFGGQLYTYNSSTGVFSNYTVVASGTTGVFGDFEGDFDLDIASECQIYSDPPGWGSTLPLSSCSGDPKSLAWGDYNGDGYLDLAVVDGSQNILIYRNNQGNTFTPVLTTTSTSGNAWSIAWADYNRDYYLDLAVAEGGQVQVYSHDYQNDTFDPLGSALPGTDARAVAWVDYDGDGWMDLSVGDYSSSSGNYLFQNQNGSLNSTPVSLSASMSKTTSLAWGDWDDDGDLDLAVGNDGERDQVYQNLGGSLSTSPAWESTEISATTGLAWGDQDGDGDLDLAVSGGDGGGVYPNNTKLPGHIGPQYQPLPRNPSYLSVARPGDTDDAYFLSSGQILGQGSSAVTVTYTLYDPENDPVAGTKTVYQFSLDGGSTWITASVTPPVDAGTTNAAGDPVTLLWDPHPDVAGLPNPVSDFALFRVSIVHQKPAGPVQRASVSAVSPPFQLRALTCTWPAGPVISSIDPDPPELGVNTQFLGDLLEQGTSPWYRFTWDFGDNTPTKTATPLVNHLYQTTGTYTVTLMVNAAPCPVTRPVVTRTTVTVIPATTVSELGSGTRGAYSLYLPLILKSGAGGIDPALPQVAGFQGNVYRQAGSTHLVWTPSPASDTILGYRLYRASRAIPDEGFQLLATLPPDARSYTDQGAVCGQKYYITVFGVRGESEASITAYFSPRCQ
jgi:hypothetical protein